MPEAAAQREEQGTGGIMGKIVQSVGMFFLIQFAMKQFFPAQNTGNTTTGGVSKGPSGPIPAFVDRPAQLNEGAQWSAVPQSIAPIWPEGTSLDITLYISPSVVVPGLKAMPKEWKIAEEKEIGLGNYTDKREISTTFKVPKEVQQNTTLWMHFFIGQHGAQLDPAASDYDSSKAYHFPRALTQYLKKKKVVKTRNLLSSSDEDTTDEPEDPTAGQIVSYYHPNFTVSFIPDSGTSNFPNMHPAVRQFVILESSGARDASGQNAWYYPIAYRNTFWQLKSHMTEVNHTVAELPINIGINNMANWKFSIFASIDEGMKAQAQKASMQGTSMPGGGDGSEFEEFKRILLDSNPYLLSTTFVVSILHTVFEMLAFKNDVSHWRKKKDNVGTSFRTILANVVMQTIIFLYLMDNNESTSWMILFGQGMGILIEAWKITKTVNVRVRQVQPSIRSLFLPYAIVFEDKHVLSETEKKTQEYDQIAFKYLYMVAVPLLGAYAVYSLYYDTHKSWYSFVITTLVGSVYAYGFLMMVPSLYINYRLKSVAHMPGRAMAYKFLNTFIDDLFAFTIKMPTLHRLATLRDDVIFFVYLYQTWVYKVDMTRVNEFGQGGDDEEGEEKTANKPLAAPPDADGKVKVAVEDAVALDEKVTTAATGAVKGDGKAKKRK